MSNSADAPSELTKNQSLVFDALLNARAPLSAYSILVALRPSGFRAPLQVYRALEKLIAVGLVHKLESLNAFIACQHLDCASHKTVAFAICIDCDQVSEINDHTLASQLGKIAKGADFKVSRSTVEMHGTCVNCSRTAKYQE